MLYTLYSSEQTQQHRIIIALLAPVASHVGKVRRRSLFFCVCFCVFFCVCFSLPVPDSPRCLEPTEHLGLRRQDAAMGLVQTHKNKMDNNKTKTKTKTKSQADRKRSWVMLAEGDGGGYTPLPGEQTLYQSPPRTTLSLHTSSRRNATDTYSQQSKSGVVYLTNRRVRRLLSLHPAPAC
jgi:hypothetical protein